MATDPASEIERLRRRLERERATRREAERIAERALLDLHVANRELATQNSELERFAGVIAHDLRSQLTGVVGYLGTVRSRLGDEVGDRAADLIDRATDSASRMAGLIDDLLAYARAGYAELRRDEVDVGVVLERVLDDCGEAASSVDVERLPIVTGDPALLMQVFRNLVTNALKYVADGREPKVRVSATRAADAWQFTVSDNGIGIPEDVRERAFEPFERLERSDYEGTGIGLSICRRVVERHGGRIWIEDGHGGTGSRFVFTILDPPQR